MSGWRDETSGNVVIDPLTRIEGHLRIEVEVEGGEVKDAWVTSCLYRGMETVLKGREPADAFYITQRICGVCPVAHGHTSSQATEDALGIAIPNGARIVRNIVESAQQLHSHILWFYTLAALDYVDPSKALEANIADTHALAEAAGTGAADFGAVQKRVKALIDSGQHSIFTNGWFGHPSYAQDMPAELHLIGVAHYLQALEMQSEASRITAIMGGKMPHFMTSLPGGTTWVPTELKLDDVLYRFKKIRDFVHGTMIPDTLAIAPFYAEALTYGGGHGNYISVGVFESESMIPEERKLPAGFVRVKDGLKRQDLDRSLITEAMTATWDDADPSKTGVNAETKPNFTGYDINDKYTWAKAPRYDGAPMEAGPLSRMMVAYLTPGEATEPVRKIIDSTLAKLGAAGKPEVLVSLLGRVAARNLETALIADWAIEHVLELIAALKGGDAEFFKKAEKKDGEGAGMWEAPRGALHHWIKVKNGRIENYNIITPSTWNMAGRDEDGVRGPLEEALIGVPIADPERPIEAARIGRSFDP